MVKFYTSESEVLGVLQVLQHQQNLGSQFSECPMHEHGSAPFRFCPVCGSGLELRELKAADPKRLVCTGDACGFVFYLDPKVAVGTIIRSGTGRRIVLVRRAIEPGYGKWVFPGGYVDRGEEIRDAAIREAREEAGLDIRLDRLINVYSYSGRVPVIIVFAATRIGGTLAVDDEGLEAREFEPEDIPWDDLAFRSTHEALREYFDLSPLLPADRLDRIDPERSPRRDDRRGQG
jgi:ADP-ribose pyrophosphatase YjhB (NUDIX family)